MVFLELRVFMSSGTFCCFRLRYY